MRVPYIDTHCHLDHHFELSAAQQVDRAREAGVTTMITVGTDLASSVQSVETARRFDGVHAAVGIHPNDAVEATSRVLEAIEALAADPVCVAVGETGLDYYREHATPEQQDASFRAHVGIAKRTDRTLVIHCRNAWADVLRTLDEVGPPERVVMHCFSGDVEVVEACVDRGYFASFAGNVTFKNAHALRDAAVAVPRDLLLTETDSPYLTPHPHRGQANDPSFVVLTLRALAELHDCSVEDLAEVVAANTAKAFALPPDPSGSSS